MTPSQRSAHPSTTHWLLLALALGFASVTGGLATSCGEDGCSEKSCPDGCCGADGLCRPNSPTSCGVAGARCDDCTSRRLGCFDGTCQAYQQECLPLHRNCNVDQVCCSGICSKGLCSEARCKAGGGACQLGQECCSGQCENDACTQTTCGGAGDPCSASQGCCGEFLECDGSVCVPGCKGQSAPCAQDDECCTLECIQGSCAGGTSHCEGMGSQCAVDGDCCAPYICVGGSCST